MGRISMTVGIAGLLSTFGAGPPLHAQPAKTEQRRTNANVLAKLEGSYRAKLKRDAMEQRIEKAIDRAVDGLFFVVSGVARDKLEDKNPPIEHMSIEADASSIAVTLGSSRGRITYRSPRDGGFVVARDPNDEKIRVSQRVVGDTLKQIFVSSEGRRINTLRVMPDGTLRMHVSVRSDKLSAPAEYSLPFRRVDD